jgi:hypothetical protein
MNLQQHGCPPATGSAATCSYSSKQMLWIALGIVPVLLVVLVVVIAKVSGGLDTPVPVERKVPSPLPVPPPSPTRNEYILSYINSITLSGQTLYYPPITGTAEERAVEWLIKDDLNTDRADLKALRQRYALSTLWFTPTPTPFGTDDDNHAGTWIPNLDECTWLDAACDDNGRVTALYLSEKNVRGLIPELTAMISLDLSNNKLTGTISSSLAAMTDLVDLWLDTNLLTGTIPSSLGLLTAMTSLQLWNNQLNGTIPSSLAATANLVALGLSTNILTGTIPSSLGLLTAMTSLQLWNNRLNGTIPLSFAAMTDLVALGLSTNLLTGTIPSSLGLLTALTGLWLQNNQLNGTLPSCDLNPTVEKLVAD